MQRAKKTEEEEVTAALARAPHVLRAHDVTDVSSCLFWIVGEKEPARPHNKIKKVNKQAAFTLTQRVYFLLNVPACAASFRETVKRANQRWNDCLWKRPVCRRVLTLAARKDKLVHDNGQFAYYSVLRRVAFVF